jgi:hypothetical protein
VFIEPLGEEGVTGLKNGGFVEGHGRASCNKADFVTYNTICNIINYVIEFKYECDGYLNVAPSNPLLRRPFSAPLPTEEELAEIF